MTVNLLSFQYLEMQYVLFIQEIFENNASSAIYDTYNKYFKHV